MEAAIQTLVAQFKAYAQDDDSSGTLSKEEFCRLVTAQLPNYAKGCDVDKLMRSQDENNDGELTFSEFWKLIGQLASDKEGGLS